METKKLIHVYKPGKYGFADYLRAIYSIYHFAETNGYMYSIAFNHPIGDFFENDTTEYETTAHSLQDLIPDAKHIVIESNYTDVTVPLPKGLIQRILKPKAALLDSVEATMNRLKLRRGKFVILHARFGDEDRLDANNPFIGRIRKCLSIIKIQRLPILMLSSSQEVLNIFKGFPGIIITGNQPVHTVNGKSELNSLKNTVTEFYLMEHAKKIYNISGGTFGEGRSGFSYWASVMFGVPFTHFD